MSRYSVIAPALNLRSAPNSADAFNIIDRLSFQTVVEIVEKTSPKWWKVKILPTELQGYVANRYLKPYNDSSIIFNEIAKVDYPKDTRASLYTKAMMHKPIGTPNIPFRDETNLETKLASIELLINTLNVSQSERYRRTRKYTFCNIYAYDFCHFSNAYIPRVWWKEKALVKLKAGENVELLYGKTVYELNANALHNWLLEWGDMFGWKRMQQADEIQNAVNNNGGVGIICAKRKDIRRSGHITVIVPENETHKAFRQAGVVLYPLQSQAGARNFNYFSKSQRSWWKGDKFSSFVFFYHD